MLPSTLNRLMDLLARLPGVGEKTAQRFALFLASQSNDASRELGETLLAVAEQIKPCDRCGNLAEVSLEGQATCGICRDNKRNSALLCVVARVQDLLAIERSGRMRGRYFVLGKLLSPLDGIGPELMPINKLLARIQADAVTEVILATPPSVDGEATALFLARELGPRGLCLSRIASGIPHGGDLEYADQITLGRAIEERREITQGRQSDS